MNNFLEIQNLTLKDSTSDRDILHNFNFSLKAGSIHALVGASGSGKSTLAFALLNLIPSSFSIQYETFQIFSEDFTSIQNWNQIRGLSIVYIPQNPVDSFHPYLNLKTQIEDYFREKKIKVKISEILTKMSSLGIKDPEKKLNHTPLSLSGGERQRVLIAISSIIQPKILIADEPTTALDSVNENLVLRDLFKINQNCKTSILFITHDRRIVRELADEVTVLNSGKIMDHFTIKKETFPSNITKYSQNLLFEKNELK